MHAHSIFMLTPYISHVCCTHGEEGGGGGASAGELMALQEQQGDGGTSKFRRFECNEGDDADSNVPTRPDPPAS